MRAGSINKLLCCSFVLRIGERVDDKTKFPSCLHCYRQQQKQTDVTLDCTNVLSATNYGNHPLIFHVLMSKFWQQLFESITLV